LQKQLKSVLYYNVVFTAIVLIQCCNNYRAPCNYINAFIKCVGGFASDNYWSSSENDNNNAWNQNFNNGNQNNDNKNNTNRVRAVRGFKQKQIMPGEFMLWALLIYGHHAT